MPPIFQIAASQFLRSYVRDSHIFKHHDKDNTWKSETHDIYKRQHTSLDHGWLRLIVIFGFVVLFCLLAALTGCLVASCHPRCRKRRQRKVRSAGGMQQSSSSHTTTESSTAGSSEGDAEALTHFNALMANDTFRGREWSAYHKEMRAKAKRQARGVMNTSQGIPMPISVRQLKGKMRNLSRSLIRSMTRSDPATEHMSPPTGLDEVLARLKPTAGFAGTPQQKFDSEHGSVTTEPTSRKDLSGGSSENAEP